jgi:hypothetical protein
MEPWEDSQAAHWAPARYSGSTLSPGEVLKQHLGPGEIFRQHIECGEILRHHIELCGDRKAAH